MTDKNLFIGGAIEKYGEENLKGRLGIEGNVIGCMIQDLSLVSNANQKHFITRDGNEIFKVLKKIYDDDISVLSEVDYMRYANENGISYKEIAEEAFKSGRKHLATMLLEFESRCSDRV